MFDNSVQNEVTSKSSQRGYYAGPSLSGGRGTNKWNGEIGNDGVQRWTDGKYYHRIDGPAIISLHGEWRCNWYLNGALYSFEDWKIEVRKYYDTQEDYLLMLLKLD
jgi:hypothetical protein